MKAQCYKFSAALLTLTLGMHGCGTKDDDKNDEEPVTGTVGGGGGGGGTGSSGSQDMRQSAFSNVEDVTDAINDDAASSGAALWMQAQGGVDITAARTCEKAEDGTVSITVARSGSGTRTVDRDNGVSITTDVTASGSDVRKWTAPEGQAIDCTSADGTVRVAWKTDAAVEGLKLDITINKSKGASSTATKAGVSRVMTRSSTVAGTRNVEFAAVASDDVDVVARQKTIVSSVSRTETSKIGDAAETSTVTTNATKEGAPLVVTVERAATGGALLSKTVKSGTMVSTAGDNTRVETAFTDLVFDVSADNANKCMPVSGTIAGSSFAAGATDASSTFVITFGGATDSGVSIAVDGGAEEDYPDYDPSGCDLEREVSGI